MTLEDFSSLGDSVILCLQGGAAVAAVLQPCPIAGGYGDGFVVWLVFLHSGFSLPAVLLAQLCQLCWPRVFSAARVPHRPAAALSFHTAVSWESVSAAELCWHYKQCECPARSFMAGSQAG